MLLAKNVRAGDITVYTSRQAWAVASKDVTDTDYSTQGKDVPGVSFLASFTNLPGALWNFSGVLGTQVNDGTEGPLLPFQLTDPAYVFMSYIKASCNQDPPDVTCPYLVSLSISFSQPVTSFGLDYIDELVNSAMQSNYVGFFGVTSTTPLASYDLPYANGINYDGTFVVIDNISYGSMATPEPAAWVFLLTVLALIGFTKGRMGIRPFH